MNKDMTRQEEIELAWFNKEVQSNHRYDEKTFKEAVEWADSTFLKKKKKYLRDKIILYVLATTIDQREEWFNNFRKAMEE